MPKPATRRAESGVRGAEGQAYDWSQSRPVAAPRPSTSLAFSGERVIPAAL
jgi:hypothetical protein